MVCVDLRPYDVGVISGEGVWEVVSDGVERRVSRSRGWWKTRMLE